MQKDGRLRIPHTELEVSPLCYGAGSFGTGVTGAEADKLLGAFIEAGGNFFDTAHCYAFWVEGGLGASERELAASLRRLGYLDQAVIATKGGHPDAGEDYRRPDYFLAEQVIASDIDDSLRNLGLDYIALYFLHRDDTRMPVSEIMDILNRKVEHGRIGALGASNWSVERIAEANAYAAAHGLQGFVASQVQWSLAEPDWKPTTDPTVRYVTQSDAAWYASSQIPITAYSATACGYFAGSGQQEGMFAHPTNTARYQRAQTLASQLNATPTQIALAYLLHQEATVIPLFSTTKLSHLEEIIGVTNVSLTSEQVRWLRDGDTDSTTPEDA